MPASSPPSDQPRASPAEAGGHSHVPTDHRPSPLVEQRQSARVPFRGRARAIIFPPPGRQPGADCEESEVLTSDLSRSGAGILHRKPLYPGQQLLLVLNETSQLVEVCWCCRVWSGLYVAGCRFVNSPEAELNARLNADRRKSNAE